MSASQSILLAGFPAPFYWRGAPVRWAVAPDNTLTMTAGPKTDWFLDPGGNPPVINAPALLMKSDGPAMLRAYVSVDYAATYDAGVLTVYQSDQSWGKLCLELSPAGELMVVSVVTKGTSDDCNSVPVGGRSVYLRLSRLERAYAFHYSRDGKLWHMVRYFSLGDPQDPQIGFLVQSPTGEGCTATFREISYRPEKLGNIRNGE